MPTTTGRATDFITFSRTSNATVTDSNGFIKWAGHNLLTNSESFDASAWQKVNITLTANNIVAPNGTTTADKVAATASTGTAIYQNLSNAPSSFTYRLWVKKGSGATDANRFGVRNVTTSTDVLIVNVNYDTGAITYVTGSTGATMTDAGNGWWLLSLSVTSGVTEGNQITLYAGFDFNGETAGEFNYIWGAHLYRSDLGSMVLNPARGDAYYPTTPRNLLGFTENITVAPWFEGDVTRASNVAIAPNGLQTADSITDTTATSAHLIVQTQAVNAGPKTVSIYAKTNTWNFIQLSFGSAVAGRANFDVTNGVAGSTDHTSSITSVGNGWYRCSVTLTTTAANLEIYVGLITSNTAARLESYAGTGVRSVYLWGAQLSDSASLDAYSPVYDAAVTSAAYYAPRLDFDPVTLAALGLLVEEQRANLATYSEAFDDAVWAGATAGIASRTANTTAAPTGTSVADTITANNALAAHYIGRSVTWTAAVHTVSVFIKYSTQQFVQLNTWDGTTARFANFDIQNGVAGTTSNATSTITSFGNGWYRCTMTGSAAQAAASGNWVICFANSNSASSTPTYTTAGTEAFFVYGAQLEAGSFATSYIPTGASTATRTADVASVSTQAFPLGSTEGTIVTSATPIGFNTANFITTLQDASLNNFVQHYYQSATNLRVNVVASGGTVAEFDNAVVMGATHKVATAFKANDFASSFNGGSPQTDNTGTAPTGFTTLNIGRRSDGFTLNGHIRQITYIPRRLSNSELQARTV